MSYPLALSRWIVTALFAILAGCQSFVPGKPAVDYKRGYGFSEIERVAFAPVESPAVQDPLLSEAVVRSFHDGLVAAIEERGLQVVEDRDQAQLLVRWHLITREALDVREYNSESYYHCWRCGPSISGRNVEEITLGTLIVDMIDPALGESVWRGVLQGTADVGASGAEMDRLIRAACARMLEAFPPKFIFFLGYAT